MPRVQHLFLENYESLNIFEYKNKQYIQAFNALLMKQSIFFTALLSIFSCGITFATNIDVNDPPPPPPMSFMSFMSEYIITLSVNATDLTVYFESQVGIATITVYNEFDQIIDQQTVDTDATTEVIIPINSWLSGNYRLTITYGTTTLIDEFQIE